MNSNEILRIWKKKLNSLYRAEKDNHYNQYILTNISALCASINFF